VTCGTGENVCTKHMSFPTFDGHFAPKVKFTGVAQNLGQLQASDRDFQSNCLANLRILREFLLFSSKWGSAALSSCITV
jgi:hypothetical protein